MLNFFEMGAYVCCNAAVATDVVPICEKRQHAFEATTLRRQGYPVGDFPGRLALAIGALARTRTIDVISFFPHLQHGVHKKRLLRGGLSNKLDEKRRIQTSGTEVRSKADGKLVAAASPKLRDSFPTAILANSSSPSRPLRATCAGP